ncbi:hypothetical protein ACVCIH_06430 [Burkholderia glumae]|uniref:hypothetical protein n=1 Tax=Burkholderia glumae TaxID=337 RepID=UPI001373FD4D|nr:hypothetical protein [Burkholderia glumae]QHP94879.1 hypothetical protein EXE55_28685 [Burkholderia glumae]QKM51795.1 hypothetical protein B7760_05873 [Burkholderia glumae]
MKQTTAMGELAKTLAKLEGVVGPMTFGEFVASELIGEPLADHIVTETWRAFVTVQVNLGTLKAELPVSETSLVHGLTEQGRTVVATFALTRG